MLGPHMCIHPHTHRKNMPACTSVFEHSKHTFLGLRKHLQKGMCYFGRPLSHTHTRTDTYARKTSCSCSHLSKDYSTQTTDISKRPVEKAKGKRACLSFTTHTHTHDHIHTATSTRRPGFLRSKNAARTRTFQRLLYPNDSHIQTSCRENER